MTENEKLREAIRIVRQMGPCVGSGVSPRDFEAAMACADAAERSLVVSDDDEVREAVENTGNVIQFYADAWSADADSKETIDDWQTVRSAALSSRTRWYTVERDGMPEKTRACVWSDESLSLLNAWHADRAYDWAKPRLGTRYTYLDPLPVEEPLPKCWCGSEADVARFGDEWQVSCDQYPSHGEVRACTEAEARENWRKMRGGG